MASMHGLHAKIMKIMNSFMITQHQVSTQLYIKILLFHYSINTSLYAVNNY